MFLRCNTNNRARTVFYALENAVATHGLPSSIRGDQGTENYGVAWYMLSHPQKGPDKGIFMAGKSSRNERLWVDVFYGCTALYYDIFCYLEETGYLDINDELHVFAIQYVSLPKINKHLSVFAEGWDSHHLRKQYDTKPVMDIWKGHV